jgi:hypothetical protein
MPASVSHIQWLDADPSNLAAAADRVLHVAGGQAVKTVISGEVQRALDELGVVWQREPTVAGVRPDFVGDLGNGRRLVLEVKSRADPSLVDAIDARTQAERIRERTGAEASLVVFPQLDVALPTVGIVGLGDLREYIRTVRVQGATNPPAEAAPGVSGTR